MAGKIRISPDQVRGVASQFRSKSSDSGSMAQQLTSAVNGMQADWEGMAQQRFYNDFTQWQQQMNKYVQLLNGIAQQLDSIANTIEQTDQQLANGGTSTTTF